MHRGLIRRQRQAADRRLVLVSLSARGRKVLAQMAGQKREVLQDWFGRLTARERSEFLRIVEKLDVGAAGRTPRRRLKAAVEAGT